MTDLWEAERRFWLEGPAVAGDIVEIDGLFATPLLGILQGETARDVLAAAPRQTDLVFEDGLLVKSGDTAVLGYRAVARAASGDPFVSICTSTWIRHEGTWRMLHHHQSTPPA